MIGRCSFDYYECTLTSVFDESTVVQVLGGSAVALRGPAHRNYPASWTWDLPTGGTVQVWFGAGLEVHVVLSSGACDELVAAVRRVWPHRVSRADVALDFDYEGSFEAIYKPLHELARQQHPNPVTTSTAGDWLDCEKGRTLYLGARASRLLMRIYEKGHELTAKHPDQTFSLDLTRVEWQVRPDSKHKEQASQMTPEQIASSTVFGGAVLAHLAVVGHDALPLRRAPSTDPLYWALRQYGAAFEALVRAEPELTVAALLARSRESVTL